MRTARRTARPRPTALPARPRAAALPARARPAALATRPRRAIALLAVAGAAAALATAVLLGAGSAPAPAEPGVVPLRVGSGQGIATGFAVADGRVVTVAHVLDGPVTAAGRRVRVIRVDRRNDLALLSVPGVGAAAFDLAGPPEITSAANGEHLRVVRLRAGRPSSLSVHVQRSIVAHVRAPGTAPTLVRPALELSVAERQGEIAPGDSGAAVVTDSGEVAGIVFATSRTRRDTAYAVDASLLHQLLR
jgi:S1-C subfamily serine protease